MKKILMFGFSDEEGQKICAALQGAVLLMGMEVICVEQRDYLQPLGVLAGVQEEKLPAPPYPGKELPARFVLLAGMERADLDEVLPLLSRAGVGREDLKAMLTETNAKWTAVGLCRELMAEHAYMRGRK